GGEWLEGAGQFNLLQDIPEELWDQLEAMVKAKRNTS
ncbi:MAG: short-chain dehydrogenase, partial [Bacteroidota bacterium]|nr:short-chain dehydrogenase [Bacteroidota bacterium]